MWLPHVGGHRHVAALSAEDGFTLVELLTVAAILIVVVGGIATLLERSVVAERDMNNDVKAQQSARLGLDKLRRELHCATSAVISGGGTTVTATVPCVNPNASNVSWCLAASSATRWGLYRAVGNPASCSAGATKFADYLTNTNGVAFWYDGPWAGSLARLHVDLKVDVNPARPADSFELCDEIVLRNSTRPSATTSAPATSPSSPSPPC